MKKLTIIHYPDPILRKKTTPVDPNEPGLKELTEAMFETMYAAEGVGLAANQVGIDKKVAVIDCSGGQDPDARIVLINPVILKIEDEVTEDEGCLSFPGIRAKARRGSLATVRAYGLDGKAFEMTSGGLLGKALQHETDHLDGKVFIDKISLAQKALINGQLKELKNEYNDAHPPKPKPKVRIKR